MVEMAVGAIDDAPSDDDNGEKNRPANPVVVPPTNPAASTSSAVRHAQLAELKEL